MFIRATISAVLLTGTLWASQPNVLIISIDTLRVDRLGAYGYERNTSPFLDKLIARGARFDQARTVEPLTAPAMVSTWTGKHPHDHGATRNGLAMYDDMPSLPKMLAGYGYDTAAFVSNWTLRDRLSGLGEHFDHYGEVFTRKRWFGLFLSESTAKDITDAALSWLDQTDNSSRFFWVHYSEPHAPYRMQDDYAAQVGIGKTGSTKSDRYDTEIAFTDAEIGRLLGGMAERGILENTLIVFMADHGESLGEHDYWGHGRHLYEPTLHIPFSITWPEKIAAGLVIAEPALILDIPQTVMGLLGLRSLDTFDGYDWSDVLMGKGTAPADRITYYQAHKGAVKSKSAAARRREQGLLEVAMIQNQRKEVLRIKNQRRSVFDLNQDPKELNSLSEDRDALSDFLAKWALAVEQGLYIASQRQTDLSAEDQEQLRALGYIE